jgi:hypothetical protein
MATKKVKRRLSSAEEFEVMKLVLDKVLWLGIVIMGYGFYIAFSKELIEQGAYYFAAGAVILVLFAYFLVKEFERIR